MVIIMNSFINPQTALKMGIVEPSRASEIISKTYLHCILKGLHTSPQIIPKDLMFTNKNILNVTDINCLVIPDRCIGLPVLAALRNNIKVIAVDDHENVMQNNLDDLKWHKDQFYRAKNYLEAAGLIAAFKKGIDPATVLRPLEATKILGTEE